VQGGSAVPELIGEVSGGSALELSGSATVVRLDVSGGSRITLLGLTAENADLDLSGGSSGEVTVTGSLKVEASGGSRLEFAGSPRVTADASGGSEVKPH
jgi:hypothetical protein